MFARLGLVMVMALALSVAETGQANAQCGVNGGFYNYGYGGFGFDVGRLYGVLAQNVPYYAAFPPVYYSAPVPRTYGYSPFAYPPGTRTPEIASPLLGAKEIINPFVKSSGKTEQEKPAENNVTKTESSTGPLAIVNPYVTAPLAQSTGPVLQAAMIDR